MAFHNEPTKIMSCSCKSKYQDEVYGQGMRVHNPRKEGNGTGYKCTVCGTKR